MSVAIPMVDIPAGATRILGSLTANEQPLPLQGVQIQARVIDRVAEVTVEQKFGNPFTETIEALYVFPLSGGSAVSRFEAQIGKRIVRGRIEERAKARREYADALEQGKRAALLEQERDDVFTLQVGNITPGDTVTVRLTYSERLPFFEDGRTELRLPLVVAPRYVGGEELPREQAGHGVVPDSSTVPDASRITPPRLLPGFDPKVSLGVEVELFGGFSELACSQHAVSTSAGPESAKVMLARERERLDRDFVLRWRLAGRQIASQLLVHDGFAMLSLLPPAREGFLGPARDVVFVLDRSGSMEGVKMASAARACALLLRTLGPRDRFAVQAFDNAVEWMSGDFIAADEGGIARGEKWLRGIAARGGTELDRALGEALDRVRRRGEGAGRVAVAVLLTDGQVGDESSVLKRLQGELGEARLFTVGIDTAVNGEFLRRVAALGGGTSTLVEPGSRLEEALQAVGREIGTPLVTDLRLEGDPSELAPSQVPDLFAGRAATAFFRTAGGPVKVTGRFTDGSKFEQELEPRPAPLSAIDHLWARARVADLEDQFRGAHSDSVKAQIVALSIRHSVLTRFTAFVLVDDEVVSSTEQRRTVVQPVEMPAEWQMPAGGVTLGRAVGTVLRSAAVPGLRPATAMAGMPEAKAEAGFPHRLLQKLSGRLTAAPEPPATEAERLRAYQALCAFLRTLDGTTSGTAGAQALEQARQELLRALGASLAIATAVPLLQAFLRGAAVEIVAALQAGAADRSLHERHSPALRRACDEALRVLHGANPPAANFWESSI